jgi:RNA polymerase sigma factor (sigma-70 family)
MSDGRAGTTDNMSKLLKAIRQGQTHLEEVEIAKQAAEREFQDAMDALYREYHMAVLKFCIRILPEDAQHWSEDIAQDIFTEIHTRLPGFRGDYGEMSFRKWFYTIVRRMTYRSLRKVLRDNRRQNAERIRLGLEAKQSGSVRRERMVPLPDTSGIPEQQYERVANLALQKRVFEMLPLTDQALLSMYADPEYSSSDVAEIFGISEEAVRQRVRRARQLLTKYINRLRRDLRDG